MPDLPDLAVAGNAPPAPPPAVPAAPVPLDPAAVPAGSNAPELADLFRKERLRFWLAFAILLWPLGPIVLPLYVLGRWLRGYRDDGGLKTTARDVLRLWLMHPLYVLGLARVRGNLRLCLAVLLLLPLFAITLWGIYLADWNDASSAGDPAALLQSPLTHPPMGTDGRGRGLFSQIANGAQHSYVVSLLAVAVAIVIGLIGGRATEHRRLDGPLMTLVQVLETIPLVVLLMVVLALFSDLSTTWDASTRDLLRIVLLGLVLGIGLAPPVVRLIRDKIRTFKSEDFVTAAKAHGITQRRIIWRHIILANALSDLVIAAAQTFAAGILTDISVSYVFSIARQKAGGEPYESWAWLILSPESRNALIGNVSAPLENWWLWFFPVFFTVATIIGMFLFGDGLRQWDSPRDRYNVVDAPFRFEDIVLRHLRAERRANGAVGAGPLETIA